jgi:MFS family permease
LARLARFRGAADRFDRNIWLLLGNTFFVFLGLGVFALVFNLYLTAQGYKEDFIGLFSFANTAAIGAFAIPAGAISNRFGPRACLAAASAMMGISGVILALVSSPVLVIALGVAYGISNALIFVPSGPFLVDHTGEEERLQAFSFNFATMSSAQMIGSLASGYLPGILGGVFGLGDGSTASLRLTLIVGALACLLGVVPMLLARVGDRQSRMRAATAAARPSLSPALARRALLQFAGATFLIAVATGLILPFFNVYFSQDLGASVELIGVIFAVASLLMIPFSLLGPTVARRFGIVASVAAFRLVTAPFVLTLVAFPSLALGAVAYVARAGLISVTWPLDNAFAMTLMPPRLRATQAGIRSAAWNVGWSLASLGAGQLIVHTGYWIVFLGSGLFTCLGVAFYYFSFRRYDQPAAGDGRAQAGVATSGVE